MTTSASTLGPPQPTYLLRGHASAIHTLLFLRDNLRLLSGDADGWVVLWSLPTKRPVAVWKAHDSTVLGAATWGTDRIITHGRDSRLCVWQLGVQHESSLSTQLPVEDPTDATRRKQPWLLHVLDITTLNFCSFASCPVRRAKQEPLSSAPSGVDQAGVGKSCEADDETTLATPHNKHDGNSRGPGESDSTDGEDGNEADDTLLVAVSGAEQGSIGIHALPSEKHVAAIPAPDPAAGKTGMVMSLRLFYNTSNTSISYNSTSEKGTTTKTKSDLTDEASGNQGDLTVVAGYESGRVFIFAHRTTAPAAQGNGPGSWQITYTARRHEHPLLSLALSPAQTTFFSSGADAVVARYSVPDTARADAPEWGHSAHEREVKTGHSGQQGLCVRSDGKVFATAGWDGRARVYSAKTLKELAVLKWHKEGCYAVAFADVGGLGGVVGGRGTGVGVSGVGEVGGNALTVSGTRTVTVREAREAKVQETHWLAVGSKDAKISLWDIY